MSPGSMRGISNKALLIDRLADNTGGLLGSTAGEQLRVQVCPAFALPRFLSGGESGIRTHDALITHTHFPGVRLRPLGHLSVLTCSPRAHRRPGERDCLTVSPRPAP